VLAGNLLLTALDTTSKSSLACLVQIIPQLGDQLGDPGSYSCHHAIDMLLSFGDSRGDSTNAAEIRYVLQLLPPLVK